MKYRNVVVDVESDGPLLGVNSMVCFGAVILTPELDITFYGQTAPISKQYEPEALSVSGFTRKEHEKFPDPSEAMIDFFTWLAERTNRPTLWSDNNGYDASWINWYFHTFVGRNPFGWSSRRIGDVFCGMNKDAYYGWKRHRVTRHTHHPVDDAKGNAEALLYAMSEGFKLKL